MMMKRKRGDTPGFAPLLPPNGFSRRVPSFSLPSRPVLRGLVVPIYAAYLRNSVLSSE